MIQLTINLSFVLLNGLIEFIPNILKYGITGLSAIVFLLAYYLLREQSKREKPSAAMLKTIKSFMWIALVFALLSAASSFAEGYYLKKAIENDEVNNNRKETLVAIATNNIESELGQVLSRHEFRDGHLRKGHADVADEEEALNEEIPEDEFKYRLLKQAVFISTPYFGADKSVLEEALNRLEKRGVDLGNSKSRLLSEFDVLLGLRYKWLQKTAIPTAQKEIDEFPPQNQEEPNGWVKLPKEVWMLSGYQEGNEPQLNVDFQELESYKSELELLKQKIQ